MPVLRGGEGGGVSQREGPRSISHTGGLVSVSLSLSDTDWTWTRKAHTRSLIRVHSYDKRDAPGVPVRVNLHSVHGRHGVCGKSLALHPNLTQPTRSTRDSSVDTNAVFLAKIQIRAGG